MNDIFRSADILRRGGTVAFPTETVYGLGADATNTAAINRIFTAKGRPSTNPLIVHVADATVAKRHTTAWSITAEKLAHAFWPGPLTLVLPKAGMIVPEVTAGKNTVGLRVPNHPMALELLRAFDGPVAAPSANRSNHVSPTEAKHVEQELGNAIDLILDGGACVVGIESTVLDLSTQRPTILRPGSVTREQIEAVIGPVNLSIGSVQPHHAASSPGQHTRHYSPRTPAYRFESHQRDAAIQHFNTSGARPAILGFDISAIPPNFKGIPMPSHAGMYAQLLYRALRNADEADFSTILVEMPPLTAEWLAVRDRLTRATLPF